MRRERRGKYTPSGNKYLEVGGAGAWKIVWLVGLPLLFLKTDLNLSLLREGWWLQKNGETGGMGSETRRMNQKDCWAATWNQVASGITTLSSDPFVTFPSKPEMPRGGVGVEEGRSPRLSTGRTGSESLGERPQRAIVLLSDCEPRRVGWVGGQQRGTGGSERRRVGLCWIHPS